MVYLILVCYYWYQLIKNSLVSSYVNIYICHIIFRKKKRTMEIIKLSTQNRFPIKKSHVPNFCSIFQNFIIMHITSQGHNSFWREKKTRREGNGNLIITAFTVYIVRALSLPLKSCVRIPCFNMLCIKSKKETSRELCTGKTIVV